MNNLPAEEKKDLSSDELRRIIEATICVGTIPREGKDAAGKALESEYYYIPEADTDDSRRAAVVDGLRKPSLRNCRKQHKVSLHASRRRAKEPTDINNSNTTGNDPEPPKLKAAVRRQRECYHPGRRCRGHDLQADVEVKLRIPHFPAVHVD